MSTLYEYLNFLNEANPAPKSQNNFQSPSKKEIARNCDQEIKVHIDRGWGYFHYFRFSNADVFHDLAYEYLNCCL